jgi:RNA polymerase sigma-70 factor (ECF subfamily)
MKPEIELVNLAKAGDMQAFQRLVELNSGKMYGAAYRILTNKEQAEDCVQEAFLKMHLKLDTFNQQSKFSTWLYSVTVNVALDMLRKNAKHAQCSDYDFDQIASSGTNGPEKAAWLNNISRVTERAIGQLNDDLRIAFILRHYEERSIDEISQILELNSSTVKSRIFRAVGRLRKNLQAKVGDYETVD